MNEYSQMVKDLAKPGADIIASLTPTKAHTLHMAVGLMGEVTELLEFQLADENGKEVDSSVVEELGDIEFYFEGLCQSMNYNIPPSNASFPYRLSLDELVVTAGAMLDLVKKIVIYNKLIAESTFIEHLTMVREDLDRVYSFYAFSRSEALQHNLHKLLKGKTARYAEGIYSDMAAQVRADKAES